MKLINYNSKESLILKKVFSKYPLLDYNLIYYIESFIYKNIEEYFPNGKLKIKYRLKFNKKDGEYIEYYPNGNIYKKLFYLNDKIIDDCLIYYKNGNLADHSIYKQINGKIYKHGLQTFYCTCGNKSYTMVYDKGNYVSCEMHNSIGDCKNHKIT